MSSRKHQQYSGGSAFLGKVGGLIALFFAAILFAKLVLTFTAAHSKPLTFHKAFVEPDHLLCEFKAYKANPMFDKGAVFLASCDFDAKWAKRTWTEN